MSFACLCSAVLYAPLEFVVSASKDGSIKVGVAGGVASIQLSPPHAAGVELSPAHQRAHLHRPPQGSHRCGVVHLY